MKKLYLVLLVSIQSLSAQNKQPYPEYPQYKRLIQSIYNQIGDLTAPNDLFGVTDFAALYSNPTRHESNAMAFISDQSNSDECKMVVVYSLQKLPLDAYVLYESKLLHLAEAQRVSKDLLNRALFPGLEWSTKIQLNFQHPNVRAFLSELGKSDLISADHKAYLKKVLSGEAKRDIIHFQDAGTLPNR